MPVPSQESERSNVRDLGIFDWIFFSFYPYKERFNWAITIVFENFTASIGDFMVTSIRLLDPLIRHQSTQFATIKSLFDAVRFSNTIQLSPNLLPSSNQSILL